ncbi:hypothetical protein SUBVAR_05883 [Subdoligranulum variabile DSM 15176]|uniref:Uncharacterized protein n=1 Tax=Subdoligranulum variabile DSM 15176 TaxID=411471 RepID=D1PNG1_9FIRM|nr:hypothetical protein SUBVAR_05883 [Subdoligranulum variabile DSM 15176]
MQILHHKSIPPKIRWIPLTWYAASLVLRTAHFVVTILTHSSQKRKQI